MEVKYTLSLQTTTIRVEKMIRWGEHSESEGHYALVDSSHHGVIQVMLSSLVISLKTEDLCPTVRHYWLLVSSNLGLPYWFNNWKYTEWIIVNSTVMLNSIWKYYKAWTSLTGVNTYAGRCIPLLGKLSWNYMTYY